MQPNHIGQLSCYPTNKPGGLVFLIIASLITVLLGLPLHFLLTYALNHFGGNWPGSHGFEDDIIDEEEKLENKKEIKIKKNSTRDDTMGNFDKLSMAEMLRNSKRYSSFGGEIKKGILRGAAVDSNTADDISQIAYAGK